MIRSDCCGCMACKAICPVGAIVSKVNEKGFVEPHIQMEKCIKCDNCREVCPMNIDRDNIMQKVYAAKADSEDLRRQSQSGGYFPFWQNR